MRRAKLLIVADTHGQLDDRIAELSNKCDFAIHAGDILAGQVIDDLQPLSGEVYAVRGNNDTADRVQVPYRDFFNALPDRYVLDLPGGTLCIEHGHRIWDTKNYHFRLREKYQQSNTRAIVYGHTHKLVCDTATRPWVLNPGAAGRVRTHGGPSCLILTTQKTKWDVVPMQFERR